MGLQWSSGRRTDQSTSAHDFLPPSHTPMELHCHQSSNRSRWPGQAAIALSLHLQEVQDATNNARTVRSGKCGDSTSNNKQPLEATPVLWPRPPQEPQRALQGNFGACEEVENRGATGRAARSGLLKHSSPEYLKLMPICLNKYHLGSFRDELLNEADGWNFHPKHWM